MRPELFRLFDVGFPSYFVLLLSGFLFATALGVLWARRIGLNPDVIVDLGLAMLLAGVAGSRLLHVLADGYFWDYVHLCTDPSKVDWPLDRAECVSTAYDGVWDAAKGVCHPQSTDCFAWAKFWAGGLTYYGGFFGATGAAVFLLRRDRFPFWKAADMAGFAIPMGLAFGRMGCLLAGCCFGATDQAAVGPLVPAAQPGERGAGEGAHHRERSHVERTRAPYTDLRVGRLARDRRLLPLLGAAAQALRRAGLRGFARALRGRALPRRDPAARRARRCGSASRPRSSSVSGCSWRAALIHRARTRARAASAA